MKKSLLALVVLGAFAGGASAQSAVTIYGSFDGGIRHLTNTGGVGSTGGVAAPNGAGAPKAAGSKTSIGSAGTYNQNRIGFKGVEDLGGGLNAHFNLETGFNTGTGGLDNVQNQLFQRTALVGIGGQWGSLDFGRQYSVAFKTVGTYDPFNYKFVGVIPLTAGVAGSQVSTANPWGVGSSRFNNDMQYTGKFGPVTAYAEYAFGEVAGSTSAGRAAAIGAVYANGPLTVGSAYTNRKTGGPLPLTALAPATAPNNATAASDLTNNQWTLGAAYRLGPVRVAAGYMDEKQDRRAGPEARNKNMWGGVSYAITPATEVTGGWYRTKLTAAAPITSALPIADGRRDVYIIGATYALSKRTNLYADIDYDKFDGAAVGRIAPLGVEKQTGVAVGINHLF